MRLEIGTAANPVALVEAGALLLLFAIVLLRPGFLGGTARRINGWLDSTSRRPLAAYALLFALPIVLRLALLPIYPPPEPEAHDEHAYLIQADTFAHFQLTNPPLQPGDPLEEQYILSRPTRQSVYPPAQALGMAAGILLVHSAWGGMLIEMGILCALIFWSLSRWVAPRWAFRAALYFALFVGVFSYWTNGYWGGAMNSIGGLLMWGVMPRLRRRPGVPDALLFSLGFLIAVDTRPVESIIFVLLAIGWIFWPFVRERRAFPTRVIAAGVLCVGLGAALNGYYDEKVTGDPLLPGYLAQQKTFGVPQNFYFQKPAIGARFDFPDLRNEYLRQLALWRRGRTPRGFAIAAAGKIRRAWAFFVGVALTPVLFALPWAWRSRGVRSALLFAGVIFGFHLFYHSYYPHYEGCIFGAITLLLIQCWRHLSLWKPGGNFSGAALCRVLPVVAFIGLAAPLAGRMMEGPPGVGKWYAGAFYYPSWPRKTLDRFKSRPGRFLVLVKYSENHDPNDDWIFNDRDPAASKIVIARDIGLQSDEALIRRFPGRECWSIDAESIPPRVRPCETGLVTAAAQR